MRAVVLLVLLGMALSLSAAPAPLPRRDRVEKPTLDGEWKATQEKGRGGGAQGGRPENFTMTIRGTQMKFRVQEGGTSMEADATVTLGTGAYPRTIDMRITRIRVNGEDMKGEQPPGLGLYTLEGNTLTIGIGREKRPTSLDDKSSDVMVFTRVGR